MIDVDDHLHEIASAIPSVDPEVLTLKNRAFLAQVLLEELDPESTGAHSSDHNVQSMQFSDSPTGKFSSAKPPPNDMPISEHGVQELQKMLWPKAEGIECQAERQARLRTMQHTNDPSRLSA